MTKQRAQARPPQVRLLWDENLSPRVPQALRLLGYAVSHVGHVEDDQPQRGAADVAIVEYAMRTNTVIVTSNHDMMQICAEAGQRFVWLDPRSRQLTRARQLLLVLQQIDRWQEILEPAGDTCVRAPRTKCSPIASSEAARLATQRMKAHERRKRTKRVTSQSGGSLLPKEQA